MIWFSFKRLGMPVRLPFMSCWRNSTSKYIFCYLNNMTLIVVLSEIFACILDLTVPKNIVPFSYSNDKYGIELSESLGTTIYKEQYAYFYR